jgi:hypothetical protein
MSPSSAALNNMLQFKTECCSIATDLKLYCAIP